MLYAALRGDKSDNLPGVPGVGEKTAAKLVNAYETLDGIYRSLEDQKPKLRDNLEKCEYTVRQNVEVMELIRDVDLPITVKDLLLDPIDQEEVEQKETPADKSLPGFGLWTAIVALSFAVVMSSQSNRK